MSHNQRYVMDEMADDLRNACAALADAIRTAGPPTWKQRSSSTTQATTPR